VEQELSAIPTQEVALEPDLARFSWPAEYSDQLLSRQWRMAYLDKGVLIAIVEDLWPEHLRRLYAHIATVQPITEKYFNITYRDTSRPVHIDAKRRCYIPKESMRYLNLGKERKIVLQPCAAFVKIIGKADYDQDVQAAREAIVSLPPDLLSRYPNAPQSSPDNALLLPVTKKKKCA
jgi:DNA-binding transcriptional regulator/RsmH inhibitor MraZ